MKEIIIFILFIFNFNLNAQTNLDSLLFNKINEYRLSKGVDKVIWDSNSFKAANHHSTYLLLLNKDTIKTTTTHLEVVDIENFDEMLSLEDRLIHYLKKILFNSSENVVVSIQNSKFKEEKIVDMIFNSWKQSKGHNETMLRPLKYGACSILLNYKEFYMTIPPHKKILLKKYFATLVIYE